MNKKSYREILTRYIQEHKVEEPIVTDQVVQYTAEELGKGAADVKKAVNNGTTRKRWTCHQIG